MSDASLESLQCPSCGASTPLVGDESVQCVYCGTSIPVPSRVGAPIRRFHEQIATFKQRAFEPQGDPGQRLSLGLALLMTLTVGAFLDWWWQIFGKGWNTFEPITLIVLGDLAALPVGLVLLTLASRQKDNFRKAKLDFASLSFDISHGSEGLVCPRCAGPIDCKETRDIVVICHYCHASLLIPSVLLADQLQELFKKVLALRTRSFDPYKVRKWVLITLTAFNGIVPIVLMSGNTVLGATCLLYLTGFSWAFMVNWLCTMWALRNYGIGYAVGSLIVFMPLPAFFLFQMTMVLLGRNPDSGLKPN